MSGWAQASLVTIGSVAATYAADGEGWSSAKLLASGATALFGILANRIASRHDQRDASASATFDQTGPNGHLNRLAGDALSSLLARASHRLPGSSESDPELYEQMLRALDYAAGHARSRWLLLLETPGEMEGLAFHGPFPAETTAFRSLGGQALADAIAAHTTAPDHAHVLTVELWTAFTALLFRGEKAPIPPEGLIDWIGLYLHETFAHEFYEQAKQAADRDPVTYAALQLHCLGALRVESQRQGAQLDRLVAAFEASAHPRLGTFGPTQQSALGRALASLGCKLDTLHRELHNVPFQTAIRVADALKARLDEIGENALKARLAAEQTVSILRGNTRQLGEIDDRMRVIEQQLARFVEQHQVDTRPEEPAGLTAPTPLNSAAYAFQLNQLHPGWKISAEWVDEAVAERMARDQRELELQRFHRQLSEDSLRRRLQFARHAFGLSSGPGLDPHSTRALAFTDSILADLPQLAPSPTGLERDTRLLRTDLLARATRWDEAIAEARTATALAEAEAEGNPDLWASALWKLAETLDAAGLFRESIPQWATLLGYFQQHPTRPGHRVIPVLRRLGLAKLHAGELEDAERLLTNVLQLDVQFSGPEDLSVATDCACLANLLREQARYAEAEPLFRRALAINEAALGSEHPFVGTACGNLALLLRDQGEYAEAEPLFRRALAISEAALGSEHPSVGTACGNLALLLRDQGEYAEAEPLLRRALAIDENYFGNEHLDVAVGCGNLALLLHNRGRYAEAEPLCRRALVIREKVLGDEHPDVGGTCGNLAGLLHGMGRYAEAEHLSRRALAIREKALGDEHPEVGAACGNLANLLREQDRLPEAESLFRRSLAICEKALGAEHPTVAIASGNLANLFGDQARYAEAEPLARRALVIYEKAVGSEHPDVAIAYANLAGVLHHQGHSEEAEPLLRHALAIHEKTLGEEHPFVAEDCGNLAVMLQNLERSAEAEPLFQRALAIREKALGDEHPDVAASCDKLASLLREQGRHAEAEPLYRRVLAIREKALGSEHLDVATDRENLAYSLYAQGEYAEAGLLYRQVLALREKVLGGGHPDVATDYASLANVLFTQGECAEAEPLYRRVLVIRENALGSEPADVATACGNLAGLLCSLERYGDAEPLSRRALALREQALGSEHEDVAAACGMLADVLGGQERLAEAEPLYRRALTIREKVLGPEHPHTAIYFYQLGRILTRLGRLAEAEPLLLRGVEILEAAHDFDRSVLAYARWRWAQWLEASSRRSAALAEGQAALTLCVEIMGADHPDTVPIRDWLDGLTRTEAP